MSEMSDTGSLGWKRPHSGAWSSHLADPSASDESHFRNILNVLPVAIYATDTEGRITWFNESAAELWGQRPALGTSMWCGSWKLLWPDGRLMRHEECPMAVAIIERRPVRGLKAILERPDGSRVPFISFPTPLFDATGEIIAAVNMLVDIGDRTREDDYAQRLSAIVESSDDAIISKDLDGVIMSWNAGAQRIFGFTAEEAVGKPVTILIPEERFDEEPEILARIRRGEPIDHYETIRRRKDGSLIDVSLSVSPIHNLEGRVVGASKIARDITGEKRLREQQKLLLNEMKHRVKNTLATVQAIAMQTLRGASRAELTAFGARLGALASAHDLLTLESWNRIALDEVITGALVPFREKGRERLVLSVSANALIDGPKSLLLAMVLHELGTNAVKYGALSNESGQVRLECELDEQSACAKFRWLESGGPPVAPPEHKGFGSQLIERSLGNAQFDYRAEGLVCSWEVLLN